MRKKEIEREGEQRGRRWEGGGKKEQIKKGIKIGRKKWRGN